MTVSLLHGTEGARRPLIVRGDLRSHNGLAYHVRAQMRLLEQDFAVTGVDIHPDPDDRDARFPYPVISDDEVPQRISASPYRPIVLHHTPPDDFRSFPGAWNVGTFAWETDVAPRLRHWALKIALMDAMWAQCSMIAELIRNTGYPADIHNITWPFDFAQSARGEPRLLQTIGVKVYGELGTHGFRIREASLAQVRSAAVNLFVTVQSMSARKGLSILLHEWQTHICEAGNANDMLILRLAFRHRSNLFGTPELQLASMLQDARFRLGQDARIGVILDSLPDAALTELFLASDAYVSTTLGEGFGGPIIEAIVNHRPVIVPRHSAMCDYIPADYPLIVASERRVVGLRGGLPAYPAASSWQVPVSGAMAARLSTFVGMTASERARLAIALRSHASRFCSVPVVRHAMQAFFRKLVAEAAPKAVPA